VPFIPEEQYTSADRNMRRLFYYMRYGHIVEVVVSLLCFAFKKKAKMATEIIGFLSNWASYLGPIIMMFYFSNRYYDNFTYFDTPYSEWMYIEIYLFMCWVLSTSIFLFMCYAFKFRSKWRMLK